MADLNQHFRNIHIQNLAEQNEELRRRITKLTQIEGYVELLVDKLEKADRKDQLLSSQNNLLRQQTRDLEIKFSQSENMHGDEMRYVFSQHDQLIEEKNLALAHLKSITEKEQARAQQIELEIRSIRQRQQQIGQQYQETILQYRTKNSELERDIQMLCSSLEQEKITYTMNRQNWTAEVNQLKHVIKEKSMATAELGERVSALSSNLQQAETECRILRQYIRQLQVGFTKRQQDNSQTISKLQQGSDLLCLQVEKYRSQCLSKQAANGTLGRQLQQLKLIQVHLRTDNQTYVTDNQRLIFLLEEADRQNIFLRQKQRQLEQYSTAEIQSSHLENVRLRQENAVLSRNNAERQTFLGTKLIELKEVSNDRNNTQLLLAQSQQNNNSNIEQLANANQNIQSLQSENQQLLISVKNLQENLILVKQNLSTWEEMGKRIQQENLQLSTQNHNLSRQLANPRQLNKDYREQIEKMLKNFHDERQQQNRRHWLQKEKIREVYQYELKQKQLEFARQVSHVQQQRLRERKLQVLTERNFNRTKQ